MSDEKKKSDETEKTTEKKPKVKGKRITTGVRGGMLPDSATDDCSGQNGSGNGTWSCRTYSCNHNARLRGKGTR